MGGAPGRRPRRLLLRKPSSASRPCVFLLHPWTPPGWRRTLTHVRSSFGGPPGAPGATWAGAGGCRHSRRPRSCASAAFCADQRAACRPLAACPPPYRAAGGVTSQMLALQLVHPHDGGRDVDGKSRPQRPPRRPPRPTPQSTPGTERDNVQGNTEQYLNAPAHVLLALGTHAAK